MKISYRFVLLFFVTGLLSACEQPVTSPVPSAPVNLEINLNYADSDLVPALAAKSFTKPRLATDRLGFGGVLVVHGYNTNDASEFFAYDLACPHEIDKNVIVIPDDAGKARCPKCGSVYITMWGMGTPETQSVSKSPLRSYLVRPKEGNKLVVLN
jgi:hypothetical protein